MVDPVEQARIDRWEREWREAARSKPARGPTPWLMVLLDVLPMAIAIQLSERLRGWRRNAVTGAFMALTPAIVGVVERAKEESARRRGVATAGDAPDWPPSPMLPMAAVAVGMAAAVMRRRRNTQAHPAERIVYPLAGRLVDEAALRWRWRHYPVLRD